MNSLLNKKKEGFEHEGKIFSPKRCFYDVKD